MSSFAHGSSRLSISPGLSPPSLSRSLIGPPPTQTPFRSGCPFGNRGTGPVGIAERFLVLTVPTSLPTAPVCAWTRGGTPIAINTNTATTVFRTGLSLSWRVSTDAVLLTTALRRRFRWPRQRSGQSRSGKDVPLIVVVRAREDLRAVGEHDRARVAAGHARPREIAFDRDGVADLDGLAGPTLPG